MAGHKVFRQDGPEPDNVGDDVPVGQHDALGFPCGARRVDQSCQLFGVGEVCRDPFVCDQQNKRWLTVAAPAGKGIEEGTRVINSTLEEAGGQWGTRRWRKNYFYVLLLWLVLLNIKLLFSSNLSPQSRPWLQLAPKFLHSVKEKQNEDLRQHTCVAPRHRPVKQHKTRTKANAGVATADTSARTTFRPQGLTLVGVKEALVGPGLSLGLLEAEDVLDVALHAGKVVGLPINLLSRHEQALGARVLKDVTPVFRALPRLMLGTRDKRGRGEGGGEGHGGAPRGYRTSYSRMQEAFRTVDDHRSRSSYRCFFYQKQKHDLPYLPEPHGRRPA